jgi:hypothetical protein
MLANRNAVRLTQDTRLCQRGDLFICEQRQEVNCSDFLCAIMSFP